MTVRSGNTGFVGRERELATLLRCLDAAGAGQGQLVLVAGEPGIGKTRLLTEFAKRAYTEGWQVLAGHAYDSEGMPPYLPFTEALRDYIRAAPLQDLRAQLDDAGPEVALIAPDIRRRLPDLVASPLTSPEEQQYRLFESVSDFLLGMPGRVEARGLVIILDDLHWAEPSSVLLLQHLARRLPASSLLMVGAYRTVQVGIGHPLTALLAEQRRGGVSQWLQLAPFTAEEVAELVQGITGGAPAAAVVDAIARQTEGNPFFVGEVVRHLLGEGRDLTAVEKATAVAEVPEGVREVIHRRLERLSGTANTLLRMAAVLGDGFNFEALQAAIGDESTDLLDALDQALASGMLHEAGGGYQFSHALIRQVLYDGLSLPRRQLMHQQVARTLEERYAGPLGDHAGELAEHFASSTDAADLAKAIRYAELAAERAMRVYAYSEAAHHLEQALRVQEALNLDDQTKRCDLLLMCGEALLPAGEPLRVAEAIMPEALALAESMGDERRATRACLLALKGLERYGRSAMFSTPAWREWAERADRYAAPRTADRAHADMFLAMLRLQEGRIGDGRALLRSAVDLALEHSDPATLLAVAPPFLNWGRPEDAEEQRRLAEEALQWQRGRPSGEALGTLLWNCSFTLLNCGERLRAEALWSEVAELATRTRDPSNGSGAREIWAATLDGNLEGAVALGPRLLAQAEEAGTPVIGLVFVRQSTCRPLIYLGRGEEFLVAPLRTGQAAGGESLARSLLLPLCLAHLGRLAEAQEALNRLLDEMRAGPAAEDALTITLTTCLETAVLVQDRQAASALSERLVPVAAFATSTASVVPTCIARHLGAASALLGDSAQARAYYEQALDLAGRMRHRPEIAFTHLQLAELMLYEGVSDQPSVLSPAAGVRGDTRVQALQHLDFAIGELEQMKMQPALARARALEGRIRRAPPPSPATVYPDGLTTREVEVLRLVAAGMSNREIAATLVISVSTVFQHIHSILNKTGAANRTRAAAYALGHGLVE